MRINKQIIDQPATCTPIYTFRQKKGRILFANTAATDKYLNIRIFWENRNTIWQKVQDVNVKVCFNFSKQDMTIYWKTLKALHIAHNAHILDIGTFNNSFINHLYKAGYRNLLGIDTSPHILNRKFARRINFRDLPLNKKYDIIHFSYFLDYMAGGCMSHDDGPMLTVFASKVCAHLKKHGYIFLRDHLRNMDTFSMLMDSYGLKAVHGRSSKLRVWRMT